MKGTIGLFNSKRGTWSVFVVLLAFALVILGHVTGAEWIGLAEFVTGFVVAGHTASGIAERFAKPRLPVAVATQAPPAPPA